jgi:hypothetical protein
MSEYTQMKWNAGLLERYDLPDIGYPVPIDALESILLSDGQVEFVDMLYWLQESSVEQSSDWKDLEPAMIRLAELLAPEDDNEVITAEGDIWFLEIGPVDLAEPIVTIQRRDEVIAAMCPRDDGRLRIATYRPLDARAIKYLIDLSRPPHPEYGVQMRPNNWEYAMDCASHTTSAFMSYDEGISYLSIWEHGLGISADKTEDDRFIDQRGLLPFAPALTATQIGVYYETCPAGVFT